MKNRNKKEHIELLSDLTALSGTASHEQSVSKYIKNFVNELDSNKILSYDNLGSTIVEINNNNKVKLMLSAHMDEIGLMVSEITDNGFIKFITIGGWLAQVMLAHEWIIHTKKGDILAVTGVKPPHLVPQDQRDKVFPLSNYFLDIGCSSKKEVLEVGVALGDFVTPNTKLKQLSNPNYIMSKALDDRAGMGVLLESLCDNLNTKNIDIAYVFSTQEEVGTRGAKTSSYLVNPTLGIAIDTGVADDYIGGNPYQQKLGEGVQIVLLDAGTIPHQGFRNFIIEIAKKYNIPYQEPYISAGGTDASKIHLNGGGVPCISLCVPVRYMHSHTSILHYEDYLNAIKLVNAIIENLSSEKYEEIMKD
ncbi:MAG: M42 family metallopeptidase [Acholeplasmatales bacterium]|jgi:endoglucanase|nr:M42 family metallopeptidase [Acholeplasmatales bacterium]